MFWFVVLYWSLLNHCCWILFYSKFLKYFDHFWYMLIISDASKVVSDQMLRILKQRRKGFLSSLSKTINTAEISIENERNISKIALLRENVEFSVFKLQKSPEGSCFHASGTEITKAQQLFNENNERPNMVIIRCERL